jgi:hypothetical protein
MLPAETTSPTLGVVAVATRPNHRGFNHDPMIRGRAQAALEPVRVVVELRQEEFQALSAASGRVAPSDFLRLVALRLAALGEATPPL